MDFFLKTMRFACWTEEQSERYFECTLNEHRRKTRKDRVFRKKNYTFFG